MSKIRNKRKTLPLTLEKEYYKEIIRKNMSILSNI